MLTLGIETSCDETSAAIVEGRRRIVSNIVHSQIPIHAQYGGVVPELASRNHVMAVLPVVDQALSEAGITLRDLDLIAVTARPGLVGSLMVGVETAKMLGYLLDIPVQAVNHLEGHLLSPFVDSAFVTSMAFPFVALVVSGGHTSLYLAGDVGDYRCVGRTLDDAAGEALDKVAKRLGAPYPGGPFIDATASDGDPHRYSLPFPMLGRGLDFSFSGLKTAAANLITKLENEHPPSHWIADVCAAVQHSIVTVLVEKTLEATCQTGCRRIVVAGGVACNKALRSTMAERAERLKVDLFIPNPTLCTDNAAMIAAAGSLCFGKNPSVGFAQFDLDARATQTVGG